MKSTSSLTRSYRDPAAPLHLRWTLPPSKSLWARALLLDALRGKFPHFDFAEGTPLDILALYAALRTYQEGAEEINVSESGTAMRFVCAYLAVTTQRPVRLSGTGRQHERPIAPLVEALRSQGAKITYLNYEGYPPLLIEPSTFVWQGCELDASSSSQYLSALLLLAPTLPTGFEVDTRRYGLASRPYALMTIAQLRRAKASSGRKLPAVSSAIGGSWKRIAVVHRLLIEATKPTGVQHPMPMHSSASCP